MAFVGDKKRKIAYAPSLGQPDVEHDKCLCYLYKSLLQRFQLVTFREKSAVELCEKYFGISSYHVLDPVFLMENHVFQRIAEKSKEKIEIEKPYLLAYILDYNLEKQKLIENAAKKFGLDYKIILDRHQYVYSFNVKYKNINLIDMPSFEDWLYFIAKSNFVITDSFHGTCFALYFHKNYISLKNRNTLRFDSLAHLLDHGETQQKIHIYDRIDEANNELDSLNKLDFTIFDSRIAHARTYCLELLNNALSIDLTDVPSTKKLEEPMEYESRLCYVELWKKNYFLNNKYLLESISLKVAFLSIIKKICTHSIFAKVIDCFLPKYTKRRIVIVNFIKSLLK